MKDAGGNLPFPSTPQPEGGSVVPAAPELFLLSEIDR
jgi:hypothetical protein